MPHILKVNKQVILKNTLKLPEDLGMSKKQRDKWCQLSALTDFISLVISIP